MRVPTRAAATRVSSRSSALCAYAPSSCERTGPSAVASESGSPATGRSSIGRSRALIHSGSTAIGASSRIRYSTPSTREPGATT